MKRTFVCVRRWKWLRSVFPQQECTGYETELSITLLVSANDCESIRHADQGIRIHKCRSINNAFVNHKNLRYSVHSHCLQETWKVTFHATESPVLNRINSWSEERKVDTPNQQFVMLVITDNNGSGTKSQWGGFTGRWGQKTSTRDSKFT